MNLFKRLAALLLAAVLIIGLFPVGASAAEQEEINLQITQVNPRYEGIITEDDLLQLSDQRSQTYATSDYVTIEEAGLLIRPLMKDHVESFSIRMQLTDGTEAYLREISNAIFDIATAHTGVPTEGDYLAWQYGGWHLSAEGTISGGIYDLILTYTLPYYTTVAEEQKVDTAVNKLLSDLNLNGKTDYEKIKAVYDYICANVRYDYEHVGDESYTHQFTAYAALFDGTAVCQGYAVLLYRLALELGIDSRFIAGIGNGGKHGWNIIGLDNLYYNADATWDEGQTNYSWFLKSPANFPDHARFEEYNTSAFHSDYPMASADYVPPAHTHSHTQTVTPPTCTEQGYTTYTCSCGDTYTANYTDPTGHTYTRTVKEPTCTEGGYTSFTCACGDTYTGNEVDALGHDFDENGKCTHKDCNEVKVPTHEHKGIVTIHWNESETGVVTATATAVCEDETCTATLTPNPAEPEVTFTRDEPTCGDEGYILYSVHIDSVTASDGQPVTSFTSGSNSYGVVIPATEEHVDTNFDDVCDICGDSLEHQHHYTSVVTAPTCTEQGYTTYTCPCGHTETTSYVAALGHDYAEEVTPPTCLEDGYTTFTCRRCADTYVGAETEATGHHHEAVVTPPTCLEDGYTTYTCVCGDTYVDDETEALDHDYATKVVAPTCTEQGYTTYICIRCSDSYTADYVDPTDHSYTKTVKEPTCTEGGYTAFVCACGDTDIRDEVDPLGHTEVTDAAKEPTCTETGLTEGKSCSVCKEVLENQDVIPALGHTEEVDAAVAATCTETGLTEGKHCSVCEEVTVEQEVIPALGHSWDEGTVTKEPTAEETGVKVYKCTVCEETKEEEIAILSAVSRVFGASRDDTALEIADQLKATLGVEKFDSIIIAVGDNERFPDALSGSYLAADKGAPILIYCWNRLSAATKEYIQNNLSENGTIYILGGPPAVPTAVEEELLAQNYNVVRLAGDDRYLTNLAILKEVGVGDKEILVATGTDYPDSLSASATGLPIVLVNGKGTKLKEEQKEFFANLKGNKVTILGSEEAVSAAIEEAIEEIIDGEVNRIAGAEREDTSKLIAEAYYPEADFAVVAYSRNFPDGLCGGPLAYAMKAPLLVSKAKRESIANEYIAKNDIQAGYILGSTDVISDEVARNVFGLNEDTVIPKL